MEFCLRIDGGTFVNEMLYFLLRYSFNVGKGMYPKMYASFTPQLFSELWNLPSDAKLRVKILFTPPMAKASRNIVPFGNHIVLPEDSGHCRDYAINYTMRSP
jgi:hypothetical protein